MDRKLEETLGRLGDLGRGFATHCKDIQSLQNELRETLDEVRRCIARGQKLSPDELRIALNDFWIGLEALGPILVMLFLQKEMIDEREMACTQHKQCPSYDDMSASLN